MGYDAALSRAYTGRCGNAYLVGDMLTGRVPYPAQRWGGEYPLLPLFLDSSKTTVDIDAKLVLPYPASI